MHYSRHHPSQQYMFYIMKEGDVRSKIKYFMGEIKQICRGLGMGRKGETERKITADYHNSAMHALMERAKKERKPLSSDKYGLGMNLADIIKEISFESGIVSRTYFGHISGRN